MVGLKTKQLGVEAYHYVMIDAPNDKSYDFK